MHAIGVVLGWAIAVGCLFSVLNFPARRFGWKAVAGMRPDSRLRRAATAFLRLVSRAHVYIGLYLVTLLLMHLTGELVHRGLDAVGSIAAGLLILQVGLGSFGAYLRNRKPGVWLVAHRATALLLTAFVVLHIVLALSLPPDPPTAGGVLAVPPA